LPGKLARDLGEMVGDGGRTSAELPSPSSAISRRRLFTLLGAGVAGGVVAGTVVGSFVGTKPGETATWQLEPIPTASLLQVQGTLAPQQAAQMLEEARRCREPLARIAVWHSPSTRGGTISIVSRGYRSPPFVLTTAPSLIAIPFPAPYPSGRGQLTLVGDANDVIVALRPQYINQQLNSPALINVWWTPVEGCP
jgi:hypothetical protein